MLVKENIWLSCEILAKRFVFSNKLRERLFLRFSVRKILNFSLLKGAALLILVLVLANRGEVYGQEPNVRPKVGLVLSGGGAKGFAYIGLLKVIEEAGLPIDYIGGSSIGAIIGGLYAIGYHPDTIESLIREQDWDLLLSQDLDRKYIAYEEKLFSGKYMVSVPIQDNKIALKPSIYESPHIDLMLNHLFSPAYNITDFSKLQIPFICIGTDLLTGEPVILDEGYLPAAIRASMAIPGYWSPVVINGHYLVDGGVVNNYPAPQVRGMGADIIIGGDVQSGLKDEVDELKTLPSILDQIVGFHRFEANVEGREATDLYIKFDIDYSMFDFGHYDTIIALGEMKAREHIAEIEALADSLNQIEYKPMMERKVLPVDTFEISNVGFRGGDRLRKDFVSGYFENFKNSEISFDDIGSSIKYAYGTQYYNSLFPYLLTEGGKTNLIVNLEPSEQGSLSAGVHYDSDYQGSLLANITLRNVFGQQSKLFVDMILGANPRFKSLFILNNGIKPGIGVELDFWSFEVSQYDGRIFATDWEAASFKGSIFMPLTIGNNFMFKLGGQFEYFRGRQKVLVDSSFSPFQGFSGFGNAFFSFDMDNRDKIDFSTRGSIIQLKGKYIVPFNQKLNYELSSNSIVLYLKADYNIKLSPVMVFKPGLFCGYTLEGDNPPIQHYFGLGGINPFNYVENHVPFTGLDFIQSFGTYAGLARFKLQYNPFKNIYFTLMADGGINVFSLDEFIIDKAMLGYGLKTSYNSFLGPVEFSIMGSPRNLNGVSYFFSVGHWF